MTTTAPKRHRWTKDELAHLNRVVGHAKNKTEAFKKIGEEMDMPWQRVRSTYNNHHKASSNGRMPAKRSPRTPSFKSSTRSSMIDFTSYSDEQLGQLAGDIRNEVERRTKALQQVQAIWSR